MTSSLWQRSDGQLLKTLREQAGLDPIVLARMGTMTVQQLRGLEEGEGGAFYSPEIKAHMGRSLLAKLGHVAPPATQEAAVSEPLPAADPVLPVPVSAPAYLPEPARLAALPVDLPPGPQARRLAHARTVWAGGGVLALAALVVILIRPAPTVQALVPPTLEKPQVATASPAASEAAAAARAQAATPAPTDPACTGDARIGPTYTPSEPRKAGNFVHLVADKSISLCVVDASDKSTRIALEPGVGRTVPGAAPFVVRGELAHLKIFFQGVRVHTDAGAVDQVVLNEAPLR